LNADKTTRKKKPGESHRSERPRVTAFRRASPIAARVPAITGNIRTATVSIQPQNA